MRRQAHLLAALFLLLATRLSATSVVPVGANSNWSTDLWLRNTSSSPVTQKVGHITYTAPGFDPIVVEPTVTIQPAETRRIVRASRNFDPGLWILPIDDRLEASAFLVFGAGSSKFEVDAVRNALSRVGDSVNFYRVAVDPATAFGTWPTVMNTSDRPVSLSMVLYGPHGEGEPLAAWVVSAPPGISQTQVSAQAPDGASLRICLGACGIGAGNVTNPTFVFVVVGPSDGGTQSIRYP